jgi:hypothetical protein
VSFVPAETFDFRDRHAGNARGSKPLLNFIKLEWFDDRLDLFHKTPLSDRYGA